MPQYKLIPTRAPKADRKARDPQAAKMRAISTKARQHEFRKGGFRR